MNLNRLLAPRSIAVLGASESLPMSRNIVLPLIGREDVRLALVNPKRPTLFDQPTVPSLSSIGSAVDAVVLLVNAALSVDAVEEAASLGCGGAVAIAGGFGEAGADGAALQQRLVAAARAAGLPVVGPNCAGFVNVHDGLSLFTGAALPHAKGGLAVVSQSGFFVRAAMAAGLERRLGFSYGISSGNEAVCGLADYMEFLVDDPRTRCILIVVEKVRDPVRFFAAARRAREAGKPVIAMKLGRTERGRAIAQSHTGAIADDSWVYDIGFRQAGVLVADDVDDMLDKAQLFELIAPSRWKALRSVGIMTSSGGVAAHAADICESEAVSLPVPPGIEAWVRERIPNAGPANPLDMTGFVVAKGDAAGALFERYATDFDALVLSWWTGPHDELWAKKLTDQLTQAAARVPGSLVALTTVHASTLGDWSVALRDAGVTVTRSLRGFARAAAAMTAYVSSTPGSRRDVPEKPIPRPGVEPIRTPDGLLLPFDATMTLLVDCGIPVAPYLLVGKHPPSADALRKLGDRLVVKLANLAHRTEHGAVRVGVSAGDLPAAIAEMQAIAARHGFDSQVVVQSMVAGEGEAFVGLKARTDLGPVMLFGLGGIYVELLRKVSGRLLPAGDADIDALLDEVGGDTVFAGLRGKPAWDRPALARLLRSVARLGLGGEAWIESLDLNPVICSADGAGCVAVDAVLMLSRDA